MNENSGNNELYELFKHEITRSSVEYYFSEDDLAVIYDIANEQNDNFIKTEVLFYGSSQFPKSDKLKVRKANYYYDNGDLDGAIALFNSEHEQSVLWHLLELKLFHSTIEHIEEKLLEILYDTTDFNDEEIIQYINITGTLIGLDWLLKHKDEINQHCSYKQTFLYELLLLSEERNYHDISVSLLEELTMLEPFNAHFWEMLSMCYISMGMIDNAASAIDYSLAIDQNSISALLIKARLYYQNDITNKNIELISKQILKISPDNLLAIKILINYYIDISDIKNARLLLNETLKNNPYDKELIDAYLNIDVSSALNFVFNCVNEYLTFFETIKWAQEYNEQGEHFKAFSILSAININSGDNTEYINEYFEQLYISKGYDLLIFQFEEIIKADIEFELSYTSILLFVLSCIRENDNIRALSGAKSMLKTFVENSSSVEFRIIDNTCRNILKKIVRDIENGRIINIKKYDPFLS